MAAYSPKPSDHAGHWVDECLEKLDGQITKADSNSWLLAGTDENKARTTITTDSNWLVVERAIPGCRVTRLAPMLRRTRTLLNPGFSPISGARAVLSPGRNEVWIRAEYPVLHSSSDSHKSLIEWTNRACADVAHCAAVARTTTSSFYTKEVDQSSAAIELDITELCRLAGRKARVQSTSDEVVIELPNREAGVFHAVATAEANAVRISVGLAGIEDGDRAPACRAALVIALLRTAGSVYLVRSTATEDGGRIAAALEVTLQMPVYIEAFDNALSALTFACQRAASELDMLAGDHSLARAYLVMQGASWGR